MKKEQTLEKIKSHINDAGSIDQAAVKIWELFNKNVKQTFRRSIILKACTKVFGITDFQIKYRGQDYVIAKKVYAYLLRNHTQMSLKEIARVLNYYNGSSPDHSSIIHYLADVKANKKKFQPYINQCYELLPAKN